MAEKLYAVETKRYLQELVIMSGAQGGIIYLFIVHGR